MNQQRDRGQRHERPPEKSLHDLWPEYLQGGYFDANGHLKLEYVSRAKVEPLIKEMSRAFPPLTMHQLRRYFQHCRGIEAKLKQQSSPEAQQASWELERASFYKLDSAAADAYGKQQKKIPRLFHDFIKRNVETVRTKDDFLKGFLPHFEALVGFGAQHLNERDRV